MRKILAVIIVAGYLFMVADAFAAEPPADAILGQWYTEKDQSVVEIYKSGETYCGKIVWLKEPCNSDGTEKVDADNPDESKRTRRIIGMDIVQGFRYSGRGTWDSAKIYNPNDGKTYSCKAKIEKDKLNIRGYIGLSLLGRTTVWKRVEQAVAAAKD